MGVTDEYLRTEKHKFQVPGCQGGYVLYCDA